VTEWIISGLLRISSPKELKEYSMNVDMSVLVPIPRLPSPRPMRIRGWYGAAYKRWVRDPYIGSLEMSVKHGVLASISFCV